MNILYFVCKVTHDNGVFYVKTVASSKQAAITIITCMEGCPETAVEAKETGKDLWSMNAKTLFNKIKV